MEAIIDKIGTIQAPLGGIAAKLLVLIEQQGLIANSQVPFRSKRFSGLK